MSTPHLPLDARHLPRLAQDHSADQIEATVQWLTHESLAELRQRQAVHYAQIDMAYQQGQLDVLESEQIKASMTTDAIARSTCGMPMGGDHSRVGQPG